jgi:hypothetical protein
MNLLLLLALAAPLICLVLLSSLGFLGVLTLGLVLHVVGTFHGTHASTAILVAAVIKLDDLDVPPV